MRETEEKGVKIGIEQGLEQEKIRIIWSMYKNKFDIQSICLVLDLCKEDVEKILKSSK